MSQRSILAPGHELADALRRLRDDVDRLLRGAGHAGRASFAKEINVGGVEVIVIDGVGGAKTLRFRNPDTGNIHDISL